VTKAELDAAIASLSRIGGVYDYVTAFVECMNRPHLTDD